jgi:glycosyltransferase involved in cell wall biosynthesis
MLKINNKYNPLISILIANYNNQHYLKECIDSIKKQTYQNIEIIFHDDFSCDDSINNVSKYNNIKIIKNKKRSKYGSFNQMNAYIRAFQKSKGDIVFLLDSDDLFTKNKVKNIVNIFLNNKKTSSIFDLPIIKYENKLRFAKNKKKIFSSLWPYIPPQSCITMRRDIFKKMISHINFNLFPDIWMDFRIALYLKYIRKELFILNKNLTYYRQSPKMISAKFKFLSFAWWKRRAEAHAYVKYFFLKNKIEHKKNLDYLLSVFINFFIR